MTPVALTNPSADLASQGHSQTTAPTRLPPLQGEAGPGHDTELYPLGPRQKPASLIAGLLFISLGTSRNILSLLLGASRLAGSNPGGARI